MTKELVASVLAVHAGRLVGDGVHPVDLEEVVSSVEEWDDWYGGWARLGERYERLGRQALAEGHGITAGEHLWQASISYHYAQFLYFHRPELRDDGQRRKQDLYNEAAPLLVPSAERFEVPIDGFRMPGFLRLPPGEGPFPVTVLLGGLESTKEEGYLFENMLLKRGIATCAFDGPGQGEMFFQVPVRPVFERYTSAVVDWLDKRPQVDVGRLGVLGRSLGGYYAIRSAAFDDRFRACVVWGGLYDLSFWDRLHPLTQMGFRYFSGIESEAEADSYLRAAIDLTGVPQRLRGALLVVHGAKDDLIPAADAERMVQEAKLAATRTLLLEPEGNHCCHNLSPVIRPRMADWMLDRLSA